MIHINTTLKIKAIKTLILFVILLVSANAWAVYYIDLNGEVQSVEATTITSSTISLVNGWYAVSENVVNSNRLDVQGTDVNLILCDDVTLTNEKGLTIDFMPGPDNNRLTVWGQAEGTGTWIAHGYGENAAIGGSDYYSGIIIINGGTINATSHDYGAAIGGGRHGTANVTINGGKVTALAQYYGAAIGGGWDTEFGSDIVINGGIIHAPCGYYSTGIGTGRNTPHDHYVGPTEITLNYSTNVEIYAESYDGIITVSKRLHDGNTIIEPCEIDAVIYYNYGWHHDPFAYKTLWSFTGDALMDYLALDGTKKKAMVNYITNSTTLLTNGWWAVNEDVTVNDRIESVEDEGDDINIILCDGKTFTNVEGGYFEKNLTVWGQSKGTGTWNITSPGEYTVGILASGSIAFNGGNISAQGGEGCTEAIVGADNITINRGQVVAMPGIDSDNLIISDGAQLIHMSEGVTATVQKNISQYTVDSGAGITDGWYFITSPVTTSYTPDVTMLSNDFDLYRLNNTLWENWKQTGDHYHFDLENSRGYLYANSEDVTLEFKGTVLPSANSKNVNVNAGFNLIGNPLLHNVYADRAYYRMNDEHTGIVAVENYQENPITPCTGIIVNADASGTVTFTKEAPALANDNGSMQITLAKEKNERGETTRFVQDNAIVSFNAGTTLPKFRFSDNAEIYIPQDGDDYAIAYSDRTGEMPLHFKAQETGQYTVTFDSDDLNGIKLVDRFEGVTIDLSTTNSYTFTASAADSRDRFVLVFSSTGMETGSEAEVFAYQSGSDIIVTGEGELQVFDMMGRMVMNLHVDGVETCHGASLRTGVYILKLNNKVQKIVIR